MAGPYRIGVAGFGIAGGTASYLLARDGHVVTLFERSPTIGPVGAGILLQPSGQVVLKRLGVLDDAIRDAEPVHGLLAYTHRGRILTRLSYSAISPGCQAYGVHRGSLFDVINKAVRSTEATVVLDCEIVDRRIHSDGLFAIERDGREYGPFDFLVAADGSKSALRAASGIRQRVHTYPYGAIWGVGDCSAVRGYLFQVVEGTAKLIGLLPIGKGQCTLFVSARPGEWAHISAGGFGEWSDDVLRLCPKAEEVFVSISGADQLRFTDYRHAWMQSWHDDRIVFLGDAAHAMSPHLGQGVNLALMDAESLASALSVAPDYPTAFRIHEETRRRHIGFYSRLTFILSPFFQSGSSVLGLGRDSCLPMMARIPWVRRRMVNAMAGISNGIWRPAMDISGLQADSKLTHVPAGRLYI